MRFRLIGLFFIYIIPMAISAQDSTSIVPTRIYTTRPLISELPPVIDGILDDQAWHLAKWDGEFVEWQPDENTKPSQQTKFKILYDKNFLYVAYRCYDSVPSKIEKRLTRRDGFAGDRVAIVIDSYHDKRTAFSFSTTVAGVKGDEFVSENGANWDDSWNPIWYTATNIDSEGWTAEAKIPFSQLKFGKAKEQVWGLQVTRLLFREEERSVWKRVPLDAAGFISEFGELHGLLDIEPQKQLEIQPFTVNQFNSYPSESGNPFRDGSDYILNGGLDAKIGITNDLTLDLTVNPDFGQVEADPGAIALDGFQIFFEERRPFFVENKNIFDYRFANGNDNVFYSRRIGRSPQGSVSTSDGEFVDQPTNTTILGAAKFSGKTKNGWSIGLLESVTGKMYAEIDNNGQRREELVEPLTNYLVGRLQKDFNERNSFIGGIFTATNRRLEGNLDFLRKNAYTGGIDFRHSWKNREYYIEGNIVASHINGSAEAIENTQRDITHLFQRTDASHVEVDPNRTSLTGTGGKINFGKAGGGNWRYEMGGFWRSPELELNDVGFLRQADDIRQFANLQYRFLKPTKWYRNANLTLSHSTAFDFEGNYNRIQYEFNGSVSFQNNGFAEGGAAHKPRIYSNTVLRGGPRWRWAEENFYYLFLGTDSRKKFNATIGYVNSQAQQDNFSLTRYVLRLRYQPFNALNLSLNFEYEENPNRTQYVTEKDFSGAPRYILGRIDQRSFFTTLRFNYSINPNMSIQYYGQPFISRGTYTDFNFVNNSTAEAISERVTFYGENQLSRSGDSGTFIVDEDLDTVTDYEFSDPDFAFVQFRSNLVFRWEYIPGSEVFFVWSQGVTGFGDPMDTLSRSLDNQIFGQKPENTFLIKATYRFVL
ncbi:MAG: carbohydrate binding family 9 domain-containing protein [Eudoraea sp.]|nr:carbohydrate binding family 9 domain-containing protein [Eudoraea sp.]